MPSLNTSQDDTISNRSASVFDFKVQRVLVELANLDARAIHLPAYKGSVWIDKKTGEVLRLEMQASKIPEKFPEITVETAVDYDSIRLGTPAKVPAARAFGSVELLANSNECQKNNIEFRNYHKFTGESKIEFK